MKATVPCVLPKFVPLIVTELPIDPEFDENPVIVGAGVTVKLVLPVAVTPPGTATIILPVVAPVGSVAII